MSTVDSKENSNSGKGNSKGKCLPTILVEHQGLKSIRCLEKSEQGVEVEEMRSNI